MKITDMFAARTTVGYSKSTRLTTSGRKIVQARGKTSAGAGAAVVKIWGTLFDDAEASDDTLWTLLGTITLTLATTYVNDGFAINAAWAKIRAEVDSISGTDAQVDVKLSNN